MDNIVGDYLSRYIESERQQSQLFDSLLQQMRDDTKPHRVDTNMQMQGIVFTAALQFNELQVLTSLMIYGKKWKGKKPSMTV